MWASDMSEKEAENCESWKINARTLEGTGEG
jgi:hypothetical protein